MHTNYGVRAAAHTTYSYGLERALVKFSDAVTGVVEIAIPHRLGPSAVVRIENPTTFPAINTWVFVAVNEDWDRFYLL